MSAQSDRQLNYVTKVRENVCKLWDAVNELEELQHEWRALDYTNTLTAEAFQGENDGLTPTNVSDVVFTTIGAIRVLFDAGHGTNLARLL